MPEFFFYQDCVKAFSFEIIDIHTIHLNKNALSVVRPWMLKMILFPHVEMLKVFFFVNKKRYLCEAKGKQQLSLVLSSFLTIFC